MRIDTVSVLHLEYKVGQLLCVLRERNPDMKRTKNGTCSLDATLKGQCFFSRHSHDDASEPCLLQQTSVWQMNSCHCF